jgi:NAD(P)-dependent dehydrogenase (short-subunit alcohol dehydrogenase family)
MLSPSPYYSKSSFYALTPLAVLYSLVSNAVVRVIPSIIAGPKSLATPQPVLASIEDRASGRVAVVTGSNTGIGFETARELARCGFTVILACRSRDKAEQAARRIHNDIGSTNAPSASGEAVFVHPLDLSSFKSVREFSQAVKLRFKRIDVLVNNAGRNSNGQPTEDGGGLDLLFQSNFLGHYMLTCELLDLLEATAIQSKGKRKGRVVNLSSVMHHFIKGYDVEDAHFWQRAMRPEPNGVTTCDTYALSKLAAILFTLQLNAKYGDFLDAVAVSPGSVYSDIWRSSSRLLVFFYRFVYLSTRQGCQTSVDAATRADLPKGDLALYLQPYLRVQGAAAKPIHPLFEMLGPFCGSVVTPPRLPLRRDVAAAALWTACEVVTKCHWKASG